MRTAFFPSWTSPVRVRSPALAISLGTQAFGTAQAARLRRQYPLCAPGGRSTRRRPVPFRPMTDSTMQDTLADALSADYAIERELVRSHGRTAFAARSLRDGRNVEIEAISSAIAPAAARLGGAAPGARGLQHPNILPILRSESFGDVFFWISPALDARTLRARMARGGKVELKDSLILLRDMSAALAHAHLHGVVHGGLTPDDVLISGGSAVVANLGVPEVFSALNRQQSAAPQSDLTGTEQFRYVSPEQTGGGGADARSDVYAWGIIAYELLGGRHPFAGRNTPREMAAAHAAEVPTLLTAGRLIVPAQLTRLVMRCLSKDPAKRPESAREILAVLTREMLTPPPPDPAGSGQKLMIAIFVALAAALAVIGYLGAKT